MTLTKVTDPDTGEVGYINAALIVIGNGSDEFIIKSRFSNASIRVSPRDWGMAVTTPDNDFRLYHINGLNGVITGVKESTL